MKYVDQLRSLTPDNLEIINLLDSIETEFSELEDALSDAEKDLETANDEIKSKDYEIDELSEKANKYDDLEFDPDKMSVANLGLDTLHFYLEKGNLQVTQQLEAVLSAIAEKEVRV